MKKSDKQIMKMLEKELHKSTESAEIPLRLQIESIVSMLENAENIQTDFSDKTGYTSKKTNGNIIVLRKLMVTAAMLALVVTGALVMRTGNGVKVIRTDSFYEGYKSESPVINAESYEEVEKAVEEILGGRAETKPAEKTTAKAEKPAVSGAQTGQSKQESDSLFSGYEEYVASAKQAVAGSIKSEFVKNSAANEPGGVATYGDFKADIVKNDGEYLYIVSTGSNAETGDFVEKIKILRAAADGRPEAVSDIILFEGTSNSNYDECIEIYLKNNCLTAIMKRHKNNFRGTDFYDNVSTVAVSYDISDPYAPQKIREHIQDGEYVSSNLYENRLCIVTAKSISEKAGMQGTIPGFSVDGAERKLRAEEIFIAVNDPEASYLFVTVTDVADFSKNVGCLAVLGCGNEVYCSSCAIAVAREFVSVEADENDNHSSLTEIYRFDINDSKISLSGSYIVSGSLVGGVSVDENSGYFRAITSDSEASCVYVLNEKMEFVSGLKDIFPGETISSVKFIGDNGYVIVDGEEEKTMIIDFSDSSLPKAAGTIDAKAFSDALYAVSETHLLGISEDKNGIITLTLFDVSDPSNPVTAAVSALDKSCRSVSSSDSRCVMLVADKNIFGIPVLITDENPGTEISAYVLFDMTDGDIVPAGTFKHALSYTGDAAVRGALIGDILYTVSGEKVVAFDINSETQNQTEFPLG